MFWSYFASIKYVNAKVFYLIYALLFKLSGQLVLCMACVAFAAYQSLYPIMLLVPAALYFAQVILLYLCEIIWFYLFRLLMCFFPMTLMDFCANRSVESFSDINVSST